MTWSDKFDLVRHIFEFFFYVITGPLMALFAAKKIKEMRGKDARIRALRKQLIELAATDKESFIKEIAPMVHKIEESSEKLPTSH